jgi:hypothetical protein
VGSGPNRGGCSSIAIPIWMDFSTSASESAAPTDGVGLGEGKAGASNTPRLPMVVDTGGTLPTAPKAEMFEPGALSVEAWPCRLSAFHGTSRGTSDWTLLQER